MKDQLDIEKARKKEKTSVTGAESDSTHSSTVNEEANLTTSARGQWATGLEFLLSCVSMSVGLGNVWRFPYVAYQNGGGAFLIPYLLLLFLIGRPLYYMEMVLGQFSGRGPIKMWKCVPALKGVGFAQLFSVSYVAIFYNYLMAISVYYLFASFSSVLPWTTCDPTWGCDPNNHTATGFNNKSWSELYYERNVLNMSEGLWDINSISWKMVLCLIGSWVLVYLSIVKGVSSLGKMAYFTAIFPYVVLLILLVVSVTQEGAILGIKYFFYPDFEKLLSPIVWYRAVEQSFFSLAVCFGSLVMYSSYNNFNNNVNRDAIIISVLDTFTSILAGCVIFAVLGTMSVKNGVKIEEVVKGDTGLAFIVYPEGLSKIQFIPQLWSLLFFGMLFVLGIGSSVSMVETILTCVKDEFSWLQNHKAKTALVFCIIYMLLGIPLATDGGTYILALLNNYGVGTAAFLYGIFEVLGVVAIYGLNNFCEDVHFMLKSKVSYYWKVTWGFLTPAVLIVIFIYGNVLIFQTPNETPGIPQWGTGIGWVLAAIALIQIPLWMIYTIGKQKGTTFREKIRLGFQSTNDWGPVDETTFNEWVNFKIEKTFNNVFNSLGLSGNSEKSQVSNLASNFSYGSENAGFVPDESTSDSSSVTSQKRETNNPQLLSTKSFHDNY